ncbi:hypothetical protein [Spirosoma arcticum]
MEDYEQKTSPLTWLLGGLSALLLAGGIYFWNGNKALTRQNDRSERRADSLLSVRLQLETDIRSLSTKLTTAEEDNTSTNQRLADVNLLLTQRENQLVTLRRSSAGQTRSVSTLTADVARLRVARDSMTAQLDATRDKIDRQTSENQSLAGRNTELQQQLTAQGAENSAKLLTMVPRSALTGDGFRVETSKGNRKETAKAKKVDALLVSFNVPAELGLTGEQEVYLSLTDEQRNGMMPALRTATINRPGLNEEISVHAVQNVKFGQSPQRISFTINPASPIKPGVYRASVYTKNAYLGATEFRLRDSFLFF